MIKFNDYAYTSKISREAPKNKLFFGIIPLTICLFANSFTASIITIGLMAVVSIKNTNIGVAKYIKLMALPLGFLLIGVMTIIFSKHPADQEVLFGVTIVGSIYGVDYPSLMYGLNLVFRALAAVSCMYFLSLNTPIIDMLSAFQKMGVPKLLISLMGLIYNYIFVLLEEAGKMRMAQASRLGYINFRGSLKSAGELIAMLFLRTYMRCDGIYAALESRGYQGETVTLEKEYEDHKSILFLSIAGGAVLITVAILERTL